jgi:hypothetical protein
VSHSALVLPGIAVLPLRVLSYRAVASRQAFINGSHQNYHGKERWELTMTVAI